MNIKDSNKHFEKLSSFYSQVSAGGELNKIELDLVKSYVLGFYEAISSDSVTVSAAKPQEEAKIAKKEPVVPVVAPAVVETSNNTNPIAEQAPSENTKPLPEPQNDQASSEADALFSLETGTEISDKLSMSSIKDIAKAMNINERIFTIKELFGGNQASFDTTISKLNELSSYEDATKYLSKEIVVTNGWLDPTKNKKVKTFLKLIARKYV